MTLVNFRVDLSVYRGPLDLLLYLVRKHEVDVTEIALAGVTKQFIEHIEVLQQIDVDAVGEFLEMASTLMELKSRLVLPHGGEEVEAEADPADDLVQRLLEYKKFRDAASMLDEQSRNWQQHYPRLVDGLPTRSVDKTQQPIHEVELWDLVSAFGRIIRENQVAHPANIVYDDTPLQTHMRRIHGRLVEHGKVSFSEMFEPGMHKSAMIGVFLAILELVRHHRVETEQSSMHGEIWVLQGEEFQDSFDAVQIDSVFEAAGDDAAEADAAEAEATGDGTLDANAGNERAPAGQDSATASNKGQQPTSNDGERPPRASLH
ncbi:MAG: Segregation and condensation protein [Planctomycetota bacterium]